MSIEENKVVFRKAIEAVNRRDWDALRESGDANYVDHALQVQSLEEFIQNRIEVFRSFPDWHMTIKDLIAEGDRVWAYATVTGTHKGEYLELAPTGKKITIDIVDIFRIVNGKMVEHFKGVNDEMDFRKQLGLIEYTEKAKNLFPENDR